MPTTQGNAVRTEFVWDPTEPIATRPLAMYAKNWGLNLFYSHDGNKKSRRSFATLRRTASPRMMTTPPSVKWRWEVSRWRQ